MLPAELRGLRVAILGTGREGRAAWRYLRQSCPELRLTLIDEQPPAAEFLERLTESDQVRAGPLSAAGLEDFDVLVRSPGISPYRDCLRHAIDAGVLVTSPSNLWFAGHGDQRTICVTGTKGKSTTAALLGLPSPEEMIGQKFGEYSPTRTYYGHAADKKAKRK